MTIILVLACGLCATCPADDLPAARPQQPQSPPKTLAELKKESEDTFTAQWRGLPVLNPAPLAQLVRFNDDHDRLLMDSALPVANGVQYVIDLTDISAKAIFRITPTHGFKFIYFDSWDFSDPALIDRHLQVLSAPNNLQVVYGFEYLDKAKVHWSQEATIQQFSPPQTDQIVLRVQVDPESGTAAPYKIEISSPNFIALRSEHPVEFEKYVRPAFEALRQDPIVLGVDPRLAWQVLGDTAKPSGDIAAKVSAILSQFNSDDFSTRAAAEKQLQALGEPAALYLLSTDRSKLAPEQRARCDKFLAAYRPLTDEQARDFRTNVNFLLDCLYSDDAAERTAALDHLNRAVRTNVSFDVNAPSAQRIAAIAQLRKQLSPPAAAGAADK